VTFRVKQRRNIHGYVHSAAKSDIHTRIYPWTYPWISISMATLQMWHVSYVWCLGRRIVPSWGTTNDRSPGACRPDVSLVLSVGSSPTALYSIYYTVQNSALCMCNQLLFTGLATNSWPCCLGNKTDKNELDELKHTRYIRSSKLF